MIFLRPYLIYLVGNDWFFFRYHLILLFIPPCFSLHFLFFPPMFSCIISVFLPFSYLTYPNLGPICTYLKTAAFLTHHLNHLTPLSHWLPLSPHLFSLAACHSTCQSTCHMIHCRERERTHNAKFRTGGKKRRKGRMGLTLVEAVTYCS